MYDVEELITRLNSFTTCGCGDDEWPLLRYDTVAALRKALTVSPEKLSKARRAMMTTLGPGKALCSDFTDLEIEALARAAAIALGLKVD